MACTFMTMGEFADEYVSKRRIIEKNGLFDRYADAYAAAKKAGLAENEITIVSIFA